MSKSPNVSTFSFIQNRTNRSNFSTYYKNKNVKKLMCEKGRERGVERREREREIRREWDRQERGVERRERERGGRGVYNLWLMEIISEHNSQYSITLNPFLLLITINNYIYINNYQYNLPQFFQQTIVHRPMNCENEDDMKH